MKQDNKGAVLIEVLVGLFITSLVFIGVYTTISVSLINTRYLQQARQTSDFASQFTEALMAGADCEEYSVFDFIKDKYGSVSGQTEVDLNEAYQTLEGLEVIDAIAAEPVTAPKNAPVNPIKIISVMPVVE